MTFADPLWLWALLALPLLAAAELWTTGRDRRRMTRLVARPLWDRVVRRPAEHWRFIRLALLLLGVTGLVLALARPQWGIVREKVEREGVDVVLALDTSGSMATEDVSPSRFFVARAALLSLMSRLPEDRFALVAFEGEAYPLVPLTLDADAVGLFLETLEPGFVPTPGTSLGQGLAEGLRLFVDEARENKVMVLVSDGEDLEGDVDEAVRRAKEAGVIVHTVGVGTEKGEPVPNFDREGNPAGFKKDQDGNVVVSRLNPAALEAIAQGTGGRFFRISTTDTGLAGLVSAIDGMQERSLAREYSYRKKERFQVPLAVGLLALALGLLLPLPLPARWGRAAVVLLLLLPVGRLAAEEEKPSSNLTDEVLLRPRRLTSQGLEEYERGNHPKALEAFEGAAAARPGDPAGRFNLADGLYKNGKYDEAGAIYEALGRNARSPLAAASRFNLGNTRYQKQDYKSAIDAYKQALDLAPSDPDTIHNLELALRALQEQQQQQKNQDKKDQDKDQKQDQQQKQDQKQNQGDQKQPQRPKTQEEKEKERFKQEAGMSKEMANQLLDALQQNEKAEQKKLLAARRKQAKGGKDW